MRRVIFNQKGGVGKSSITCNLAAVAAQQGQRTLVVDLDVQGNSSFYLGFDTYSEERSKSVDGTVAELLKQSTVSWFSSKKSASDFVQETAFDNLFLMPSSPALELIEKELETRYKIYKLRDALEELGEQFDQIYIDTPPNFNFYSKSALIAAETVLVPFDCDSFSKQALYNLMSNISELKQDHNPKLRIEGIVVNQFNSQANLPKTLIDELRADQLTVLESMLPSSVKMKESHRAQKPLIYMAPSHRLSQQFLALYRELEPITSTAEA
jgi:chromosome partitioning protein